MMLIRPIVQQDLAGLLDLARTAGVGLTSLPINEQRLSQRITHSEQSFAGQLEPPHRSYLFALEDQQQQRLAGVCGLEAAVGLKEPWYNYRVGTIVHASEGLSVYSRHDTLFLSNDHTAYSELCTLFLHPDYRVNRNGGLLSKSRFLFLAQFPQLFAPKILAEMRGVSDANGRSPFWEGLGRHFFAIDFAQADYLTGLGQKSFVAELMPKHPVYVSFLSTEAQAVIGHAHENTQPALSMLESEGFRYEGYVDIFDAGPTVQTYVSEIRAVRDSRVATATLQTQAPANSGPVYLLANDSLANFRVILTKLPTPPTGSLPLTLEQAQALQVQNGDPVRYVTLSPKEPTE